MNGINVLKHGVFALCFAGACLGSDAELGDQKYVHFMQEEAGAAEEIAADEAAPECVRMLVVEYKKLVDHIIATFPKDETCKSILTDVHFPDRNVHYQTALFINHYAHFWHKICSDTVITPESETAVLAVRGIIEAATKDLSDHIDYNHLETSEKLEERSQALHKVHQTLIFATNPSLATVRETFNEKKTRNAATLTSEQHAVFYQTEVWYRDFGATISRQITGIINESGFKDSLERLSDEQKEQLANACNNAFFATLFHYADHLAEYDPSKLFKAIITSKVDCYKDTLVLFGVITQEEAEKIADEVKAQIYAALYPSTDEGGASASA